MIFSQKKWYINKYMLSNALNLCKLGLFLYAMSHLQWISHFISPKLNFWLKNGVSRYSESLDIVNKRPLQMMFTISRVDCIWIMLLLLPCKTPEKKQSGQCLFCFFSDLLPALATISQTRKGGKQKKEAKSIFYFRETSHFPLKLL